MVSTTAVAAALPPVAELIGSPSGVVPVGTRRGAVVEAAKRGCRGESQGPAGCESPGRSLCSFVWIFPGGGHRSAPWR